MKRWKKWLLSGAVVVFGFSCMAACGDSEETNSSQQVDNLCTVTFDTCTDLQTNNVMAQEVEKGSTAFKPMVVVVGDNPNNAKVAGWYEDEEYTDEWNFLTDTVEKDMTLYAKWVNTYEITYYLGDELETPMYTDKIEEGKPLTLMKELSDGYRSDGFFTSPAYTEEVEEGVPVTGSMNVYIHRSDEFYFSGKMIANRFKPVAAGGAGSTAGSISYNEEGDYAEINFGYSTSLDPRATLSGVTVDITSSQKVKITMKNLGGANALKFYTVAWYEDGTPVDKPYFSEASAARYNFAPSEMYMSEDDEWLTVTIDFAEQTIANGASLWGNATTLVQLGMQAQYASADENDLSNVLLVKSIEGIKDDTYVGTSDSAAIIEEKANDDAEDIQAAANAQESVRGWIFPKDLDQIGENSTSDNVALYQKEEGLLFTTGFRETNAKLLLTVPDGKGISMDEYSTLKIRLRNFGYATTLKIEYRNTDNRYSTYDVVINARETEVAEYKVNFYGAPNFTGMLSSITLIYDSVGVDNAILIESIVFDEFEAAEIPGFNFNDKNTFGVESNDDVKVSYDKDLKATAFDVLADGASFEKDFTTFTNYGYASMGLYYAMATEGVTNVNVALTIDGVVSAYDYPVTVQEEGYITLPLTESGEISNVKVTFTGVGQIAIKEIRFELDETSAFDFSNSSLASTMKSKAWGDTVSFEASLSATKYTYSADDKIMKYYPSATSGDSSMPLTGKSRMIVIYQNKSDSTSMQIGLGTVDMNKPGWETNIVQPGDPGNSGYRTISGLKTNMANDEWAAVEVSLSKYNGINADKALSSIIFELYGSIYVRAVIFYNDPNQREVKFDLGTNEGNAAAVTSQYVDLEGYATKPSVAVDGNVGVIGWYTDPELTDEWDFATDIVEDNITLYAKWGNIYSVNYYIGSASEASLVDSVAEGGKLTLRSDVAADGYYKVLGYYTDSDYTTEAVEGSAINENTDIYVKVALSFGAEDIADQFTLHAAGGGTNGSTVGTSEYVEDGDYVKVNFGYSVTADPYMAYEGDGLDITASQKIRMTFKNLGPATFVRFYFVVTDKDGNAYVQKFYNETCKYNYVFSSSEMNMSEDDEWLVKEFDFTDAAINGVSIWGQANYLVKLRIQFSYASKSTDDLSNEVLIKSIEGVEDESYDRNPTDTQAVKDLLVDDAAADLEAAATAQTAVDGWVFPKNNASVSESENVNVYYKTNGLLLHADYGTTGSIITLLPEDGKTIDLDELTTLSLRLKNLGYGNTLKISYTTANGSADYIVTVDTRMSDFVTYEYNMFGKDNYAGTLISLSISFDSVGIDNAILLESVSFGAFQAEELIGFNFNDRNTFGVEGGTALTAAYDAENLGTKFTVSDGASFDKTVENFSILAYKSMELSYVQAEGVTAVKVALTINDATETYTYDVASGANSLTLNASGNITKLSVSFVGSGSIVLQSITFSLDESASFNFADEKAIDDLNDGWVNGAYDADTKSYKGTAGDTRVYFGAQKAWGFGGPGNISLEGKSKIVIIYQNRTELTKLHVGVGITSTTVSGWETAIKETGTGGNKDYNTLQANMKAGEWAALEIDITGLNGVTMENRADWAVTTIMMQLKDGMYVRAVSVY